MKAEINISSINVDLSKVKEVIDRYNILESLNLTIVNPDKYHVFWIEVESKAKKVSTLLFTLKFVVSSLEKEIPGIQINLINFKDNIM